MSSVTNSFPRIVFVGAHMEARAPFLRLIERGDNMVGFVTFDPEGLEKMSGGIDLTESAQSAGIPLLRVHNINEPAVVAWIRQKSPDLLLVVGWTQLVKPELLRVPKFACLGFHASLLPKSRGRAPVNWAIINGETVTGNTMIVLEPEADSGDIVAQRAIPITDQDDCCTIYQKVGETEVEMLDEVMPFIEKGILPRRKQDDSQATVMPKRRPEDGIIDWNRPVEAIYNWVRALTAPYPGAFSYLNGEKIWIWKTSVDAEPKRDQTSEPGEVVIDSEGWPWVSTSDGWIRLVSVQREGGPKLSGQAAADSFLTAGGLFGAPTAAAK